MKTLLIAILFLTLGVIIAEFPTVVSLYVDYQVGKYQKKNCTDKNIKKNECYFNMYYDQYSDENPRLVALDHYFIPNQDMLYFVLSGRCTNKTFYNPSASKSSGKITRREYFGTSCMSEFSINLSDLIYGDKP